MRDWTLVETVGDGQPVRDLAFELLARAAARNKEAREDRALETEGLAPRLAIEDRFSPQAVTAALRQAVSAGWVVQNLRHARRLAGLTGAVGTRFALTGGRVVHQSTGAGTETFVLGGHQVTGQEGTSHQVSVQGGLTGAENGAEWRLAEGWRPAAAWAAATRRRPRWSAPSNATRTPPARARSIWCSAIWWCAWSPRSR